jgi:hypothetical protein
MAENLNHTPFPWNVETTDEYGHYFIMEAAKEQNGWVNKGYDIGYEEGERRNKVAEVHDEGNRTLIQAIPDLLSALCDCRDALREYLQSVESGKDDDAESAYQHADAILTELGNEA